MKDDLISRKALLNHLNDVWLTNTPNGSYDMQAAKAEGIAIAMKAVKDFRTVPAVPLETLAKWIFENLDPRCGCSYCSRDRVCCDCPTMTEQQVKEELTKWMEEQHDD